MTSRKRGLGAAAIHFLFDTQTGDSFVSAARVVKVSCCCGCGQNLVSSDFVCLYVRMKPRSYTLYLGQQSRWLCLCGHMCVLHDRNILSWHPTRVALPFSFLDDHCSFWIQKFLYSRVGVSCESKPLSGGGAGARWVPVPVVPFLSLYSLLLPTQYD